VTTLYHEASNELDEVPDAIPGASTLIFAFSFASWSFFLGLSFGV